MKTRPPLLPTGRGVTRRRRASPTRTRFYRDLRKNLDKGSLDDLISELVAVSISKTRLSSDAVTPRPQPSTPSDLEAEPPTPAEASKPDIENNIAARLPREATSVSTSSHLHRDETDPDPFRNPVPIPLTPNIFAYPHSASTINDLFQNRFREIQNYFRRNTENHPDLKAHVEHIDYGLKMCGPPREEAHPSIIVYCRPGEYKALKSLLNEKHLKRQWCRRKSSPPYYFWKNWGKAETTCNSETSDHKPFFSLYFWRTAQPRNFLCLEEASVSLHPRARNTFPAQLTLSGSLVSVPHQDDVGVSSSTVACVLQVDKSYYGLTAGHVVNRTRHRAKSQVTKCALVQSHPRPEDLVTPAGDEDTKPFESDIPTDGDDDDFISDVEDEEGCDGDQGSHEYRGSASRTIVNTNLGLPKLGSITTSLISPETTCSISSKTFNYDWGLVGLKPDDLLRPNALIDSSGHTRSYPRFFADFAQKLPIKETSVLIQTSHGVKEAMLQPAPAFLGGITGAECGQAGYWTVILSGDKEGNYVTSLKRCMTSTHLS